jgi:omega-6 fatty acid desaturase (delta-12 desaturase)
MSDVIHTAPAIRTGAELVRATKPFSTEDRGRTWRLLTITICVWSLGTFTAMTGPWWLALPGAVLAGFTLVRLFIFFHDLMHGAVFHDSPLGRWILYGFGSFSLNPPSVWKETHDYHHQNNAKMLGANIGSYPVVSVKMWPELTRQQRFWYAFARHPATMAVAYLTIFHIGMCISPFRRDPKRHWQGPAAIAFHWTLVGVAGWLLGWQAAVVGLMLPVAIANALGAYLFYAQHNFPQIELRDRKHWEYWFAALRSSSMFDMPPLMHWFTGNIGYHHVHHLNHKIPFYRLPEAMAAMPELQDPGRTSWRPRDVLACLRLKLWDAERGEMVGWDAISRAA